jgi:hypothetical protein
MRNAVLALVLLALGGCASVKLEHVQALQAALADERLAVAVKPGFEDAVKKVRDEEDNLLEQMKAACK